ncbi:tetratricopeptide repeat protein [Teichococcus wenyumeiae]|uniref:tetratricopeptide repeat protein n=1 Tax=Teichococcus wenyumeiae TaxID=2478470 RepID=UPI001314F0CB|nr:tetratricopeptide repeat protein [Pseudoroseomonas wenyumeiae]
MQPLSNEALRHFHDGADLLRQGRLKEAEPLFRAVIARYPDLPEANATLGALLGALGRPQEAEPYLRRALRARPDSADAHGNLGNLLRDLGRLAEAEACLREALRLRPRYPEALNNLGAVRRDQGDQAGAGNAFRAALEQRPGFHLARANLAQLLLQQGQAAAAEAQYRLLLRATPQDAAILAGLGESLRRQGRHAEAEAHLREALRLRPESGAAWVELGNILLAAARPVEAALCFHAALERDPRQPEAHLGLGIAAAAQGDYAAAEKHFRAALALNPDLAAAHNSLGDTLRNQKAFREAEASLRRALQLAPDLAEAQVNLAFTLLQTGRDEEGWAAYEHRWQAAPWAHRPQHLPGRLWQGEDLTGQSILLQAEQGLGDTLQFVRYAQLFPPETRVVLRVQRSLVRLLQRLPGIAGVQSLDEPPPALDWHASLLSLPHRFGAAAPAVPYLAAEPSRVAAWRQRLAHLPGVRIGLAWAGSPGMAADARRSLPLHLLEPLAELSGLSFVSLQRGPAADATSRLPLERPAMDGDDFEDTAALVMALDLVISVDTAVLHLAGGSGRPVWLLNRYDSCWRWQEGRDDSPWYPSLRQFRQPAPGDWASVVRSLQTALARKAWITGTCQG